ncbi:MAG: acylneuraminate cytidylyltransferase family protein [Bacteroidetes bacterium]|nr:acylneuraminate cytidylyltransferase family protein [Bacteroidota bacterium]
MNILAIIPARGGSKGIKRKNLISIKGKPLIAYSIEHALNSKHINRVIVSSEDDEILAAAVQYGAEVPFKRPKELAEDHVLDFPVFEHALNFLKEKENYEPDVVVHLRPTCPFRKPEWIDQCVERLIQNPEADSLRSVSEVKQHPYRVFTIDQNGMLLPVMLHEHPLPYLLRRQDLPKMYYYNCVIDVTRPKTILEKRSMTGDRLLPFVIDPDDVIDIDAPDDLKILEVLFKDRL